MDYDDLNQDFTKHQDTTSLGNESENQIEDHRDSVSSIEIEEPASYKNLDTDDVIRSLIENRTDKIVEDDTRTDEDPKDSLVTDTENTLFDSIVNGSTELDDANSSLLGNDVDEKAIEEYGDTENVTDSLDIDNILNSSSKENTEPKLDKLCQLPLGRVKSIIKSDPDVTVVSAECVFLIAKASEFFLQWLGKEIHAYTIQQKKKTIQKKDLDLAISEHPALEFLDGALD